VAIQKLIANAGRVTPGVVNFGVQIDDEGEIVDTVRIHEANQQQGRNEQLVHLLAHSTLRHPISSLII
jgi:hypothetical protein